MVRRLIISSLRLIAFAALVIVVARLFLLYTERREEKEMLTVTIREEAIVVFIEGNVEVRLSDKKMWQDASEEMVLKVGGSIKTGRDSWAEVGFEEGLENIIRIKEKTLVELRALNPIRVGLLAGELRSLVENLEKDSTFEVETPTAVCGARGTGWDTQTDGRRLVLDSYENEVYLQRLTEDGTAEEFSVVKAGSRAVIEDPQEPIAIENLPGERAHDWNGWKEDFVERREAAIIRQKSSGAGKSAPKVWVQESDTGDYQLMVDPEE